MITPTNETDLFLDRLAERHGTLFSEELGLDLTRDTPSVVFRWLYAALMMCARILHQIALKAARAVSERAGRDRFVPILVALVRADLLEDAERVAS